MSQPELSGSGMQSSDTQNPFHSLYHLYRPVDLRIQADDYNRKEGPDPYRIDLELHYPLDIDDPLARDKSTDTLAAGISGNFTQAENGAFILDIQHLFIDKEVPVTKALAMALLYPIKRRFSNEGNENGLQEIRGPLVPYDRNDPTGITENSVTRFFQDPSVRGYLHEAGLILTPPVLVQKEEQDFFLIRAIHSDNIYPEEGPDRMNIQLHDGDGNVRASMSASIIDETGFAVMDMHHLFIGDDEAIDPDLVEKLLHPINEEHSNHLNRQFGNNTLHEVRGPLIAFSDISEIPKHPVTKFFRNPLVQEYLNKSGFQIVGPELQWVKGGESVFRMRAINTHHKNVLPNESTYGII